MKSAIRIGGLASVFTLVIASFAGLSFAQSPPASPGQGNIAPPAQSQPTPVAQAATLSPAQMSPAQSGAIAAPQPVPQMAEQQQMPQQQMPQQVAQQQAPQQQMPQQMPVASNPFQSPSVAPSELPPLPPVQADVDRYTQTYFGVSPAQIRRLREVVNDRQRTVATPAKAPRPVTGTISVSLAPGTTPPVIRTYMGNSTSFVVVDSSGAPWPVENYRIGNSAAFQIYRLDAGQGSSFALDTAVPYGQSNLILKLSGVATPVVIDLMAGQSELDARVEVRVQGRGPNSITQSVSLPQGTDSRLLPVLNGIAPEGGKMLSVTGLDGVRAWMMPSGRMVVRTPVKIVSPASPSFVSSADGTHVYEFMPTTQLLGLVDGQFVALQVEGW